MNMLTVLFKDSVDTLTTTAFDLGGLAYRNHIYIIFGGNGGIYRVYYKTNHEWSSVDTIIAPTNPSDDPNFSVTVSTANVMTLKYSKYVFVCII